MQTSKIKQSCAPTCCADLQRLLSPQLFKALGDPRRVELFASLAQTRGWCSVSELAQCCPIDLSVVSRHLRVLREAGLIEAFKAQRQVFHRVRHDELVRLLRGLADAIEACCPAEARPSKGAPHGEQERESEP